MFSVGQGVVERGVLGGERSVAGEKRGVDGALSEAGLTPFLGVM